MKGAVYYVAIAKVIFLHVKITCYFLMWRYQVFARKLTWYFIGVYIIKENDKRPAPRHKKKAVPLLKNKQTRGHFACACVIPLNDSSVGASHLMVVNRKLARKVTVLLKAISLVFWIPFFPTKSILHDKNRTFSTRDFTCRFFSSRFSFKTQRQKVMFLYKSDFHWQSNAFLWFDFQTRGFTYQKGNAL